MTSSNSGDVFRGNYTPAYVNREGEITTQLPKARFAPRVVNAVVDTHRTWRKPAFYVASAVYAFMITVMIFYAL